MFNLSNIVIVAVLQFPEEGHLRKVKDYLFYGMVNHKFLGRKKSFLGNVTRVR